MTDELKKAAIAYKMLLDVIPWDNEILLIGLREGLNKFLSNTMLYLYKESRGKNKYQQGDYYSKKAQEKVDRKDFTDLVFEHMIPKNEYIQKPCEEAARNNSITIEFIEDKLRKYWKIAIITKEEDKLLASKRMPNDWDGKDIFARYQNKVEVQRRSI